MIAANVENRPPREATANPKAYPNTTHTDTATSAPTKFAAADSKAAKR